MGEEVKKRIDELVEAVYKLEKNKIDERFVQMLDALDVYIKNDQRQGWEAMLMELQTSYINKNYVCFSDILLYDMKPFL